MHSHTLAILLALMPAAALADPVTDRQATRLDIVATGEVVRAPDLATITAGVVTQAPKASDAMAANARALTAAIAVLKRAGVADKDIATASLSLQPQYRYQDNQPPTLTGYQASNQLSIRFHDLNRAGEIVDSLVAQGVNQIEGPSLSVEHREAALDEARAQAIGTARARAELYAHAAGLHVARIVAISESGANQPAPPRPMVMAMRAKADAAPTPLEAGSQTLDVTVNVGFELQ
jgi:uncharacterized protein